MAKKRIDLEKAMSEEPTNGVDVQEPPEVPIDPLVAANEVLAKELAATKQQLKLVREERCLDAIQAVLQAHRCNLMPMPNGQFQVILAE